MNAIVAVSENYGIGKGNDLLFHIPEDLKFFKENTLGKVVVMGRKTLESLPGGKPLPKRTTIVLSSKMEETDGVIIARNTEELKSILSDYPEDDVMICGGEQIYKLLIPFCKKALVTKIEKTVDADKFFPNLDSDSSWMLKDTSERKEHNGIYFTFNIYENKEVK